MILLKDQSRRGGLRCSRNQACSGLSGLSQDNYVYIYIYKGSKGPIIYLTACSKIPILNRITMPNFYGITLPHIEIPSYFLFV